MKPHALLIAALTGLALGIAASSILHARQAASLPAYVVAEEDVTDPAGFQK